MPQHIKDSITAEFNMIEMQEDKQAIPLLEVNGVRLPVIEPVGLS